MTITEDPDAISEQVEEFTRRPKIDFDIPEWCVYEVPGKNPNKDKRNVPVIIYRSQEELDADMAKVVPESVSPSRYGKRTDGTAFQPLGYGVLEDLNALIAKRDAEVEEIIAQGQAELIAANGIGTHDMGITTDAKLGVGIDQVVEANTGEPITASL